MSQRFLPRGLLTVFVALAAVLFSGTSALAQQGFPGDSGEGMPWQVAALFTVNWVLVAVAVAMMSRPPKRADKPKKPVTEEPQ